MSEQIDDPEERWQRTFHLEEWQRRRLEEFAPGAAAWLDEFTGSDAITRATSAQLALDAEHLARLDKQLDDPKCDHRDGCTATAIAQLRCRHTGVMLGLLCDAHVVAVTQMPHAHCRCKRVGLPGHLFLIRGIFHRRSRA